MRVCFLSGHEYVPESYWRVLLPARALRATALPIAKARDALGADVLWIHEPLGERALALAREARQRGRRLIVDFSEDPWLRHECDPAYDPEQLEAAATVCELASAVVVANPALLDTFSGLPRVQVIEPRLPLVTWCAQTPVAPPIISWWSDGRQARGMAEVAPYLDEILNERGCHFHHIQHVDMKFRYLPVGQQHVVLSGSPDPDQDIHHFRQAFAEAWLSVEMWPAGDYQLSVSDIGILRAAALGIPTLTTRPGPVPPGVLSAPPPEWHVRLAEALDPGRRRALSSAARAWAETRGSFQPYVDLIEEV